jgi:hypothetical protein
MVGSSRHDRFSAPVDNWPQQWLRARRDAAADLAQLAIPTSQRPLGLGPLETTTYQSLRPNSTQKTSLIGEGCPRLICCASPTSITDVTKSNIVISSECRPSSRRLNELSHHVNGPPAQCEIE